MNLPFLNRRPRARKYPHAKPEPVAVNVTAPKGHRCVIDNDPAPMEFDPDPYMAADIRLHLWLQRNAREVTP